jgi:hypothetical protein
MMERESMIITARTLRMKISRVAKMKVQVVATPAGVLKLVHGP